MTPDFRQMASLPADQTDNSAWGLVWITLCAAAEQAGCKFVRMTVVDDAHPSDTNVPHGCYVEGWLVQPKEQPEFSWPADA